MTIPFEDGHTRQLPVLTTAPFRYATYAWSYLDGARPHTGAQLKQAVISASAISLMYPADGIPGYPREAFIEDLVREAASEMRGCLDRGAIVQIDFTEARLSLKLDPSGGLLGAFVDLNNRVLDGLSDEERSRVGVHSCPGGDQDSTHSADVDYAELLPALCRLNVGSFYVEMAGEKDREPALKVLGERAGNRRIFVGVIDPIDPRIETPEEVRDRVLEAARFIDPSHLGTTDDCGFSPFGDDASHVTGHGLRQDPGADHRDGDGIKRAGGLRGPHRRSREPQLGDLAVRPRHRMAGVDVDDRLIVYVCQSLDGRLRQGYNQVGQPRGWS